MLLELPVRWSKKQDIPEMPGESVTDDVVSNITVRIDEIMSVGHTDKDCCSVEMLNGTCYEVMLAYDKMIEIWQDSLETIGGIFIARQPKMAAKFVSKSEPGRAGSGIN